MTDYPRVSEQRRTPALCDCPQRPTLHEARHSHVPSTETSSEAWACWRVCRSVATTVYWSSVHSGRCRASVSFTNKVPEVSSAELTTPSALQLVLEGCSLYWTEMPLNSWPFSTQTFPIWREERVAPIPLSQQLGRSLGRPTPRVVPNVAWMAAFFNGQPSKASEAPGPPAWPTFCLRHPHQIH